MVRLEVKIRDATKDLLLGGRLVIVVKVDERVRDMEDFGQEYAEAPDIVLCAIVHPILNMSSLSPLVLTSTFCGLE
jgi:hypothetical protein